MKKALVGLLAIGFLSFTLLLTSSQAQIPVQEKKPIFVTCTFTGGIKNICVKGDNWCWPILCPNNQQ